MNLIMSVVAVLLFDDVCAVVKMAPTSKPSSIVVEGTLIMDAHSSYLIEPGHSPKTSECILFTVFAGTPKFLIPGLDSQEITQTPTIAAFVKDYWLRTREGERPQLVRIRGRVIAKKDFVRSRDGKANGYGYRGSFSHALLVDDISVVKRGAQIKDERR